jgi:hypothetical protein
VAFTSVQLLMLGCHPRIDPCASHTCSSTSPPAQANFKLSESGTYFVPKDGGLIDYIR